METTELNVVTGAFGYTGKYITRLLLSRGKRVLSLTGHTNRPNPFGDQVCVAPFDFDNPEKLAGSLAGATTLYNTYWVRFPHGHVDYEKAVQNTLTLFEAAKKAGVHRIVHVSIANASADSSLPYFKGKGQLERAIINSGLSYAIIRPTVIFGKEDILINNIAWLLRHFPLFVVPGSGNYKMQPIYVEDLARIAVNAGEQEENAIIDAIGPETYTFEELVWLIGSTVGSKATIVHLSPKLALFFSSLIGRLIGDVVLTKDEVEGLMANLLATDSSSIASTYPSEWLRLNARTVGAKYASEIKRHYAHS